MALTYYGSFSLGQITPVSVNAIGASQNELQARLDALNSFSPSVGSLAANLTLAQQTVTGIQAAISLGISPPNISAQLAEVAAQIGAITAQLSLMYNFNALMSAGGVHLYGYTGTVGAMGSAISGGTSGGLPGGGGASASCYARLVVTESSLSGTAVASFLSGT